MCYFWILILQYFCNKRLHYFFLQICVEGNIASGKTSFLEYFKDTHDVEVGQEMFFNLYKVRVSWECLLIFSHVYNMLNNWHKILTGEIGFIDYIYYKIEHHNCRGHNVKHGMNLSYSTCRLNQTSFKMISKYNFNIK